MSVFEPSSLDSTSKTWPTWPCRMAPIRFISGPGQAMPLASIVFSIWAVLIRSPPSHEHDLAVRGRGHERGYTLDPVDEGIEVLFREVKHVHRERAGLDVDVANVLRLLQQFAPVVARVGTNRRRLLSGRLRRQLV